MKNTDMRHLAKRAGIKLWQIAERFNGGMTDGNFSRKLRKELSENEKAEIKAIIERLTQEAQPCGK